MQERYEGILGEYFDAMEGQFVRDRVIELGPLVLDLGCGTGRLLPLLAEFGKAVIALDMSMSALLVANGQQSPAIIVRGDALALPLGPCSLDTVIALGIFQFASDLSPFLAEVARVLRPNGRFLFTVWNHAPILFPRRLSLDMDQRTHQATDVEAALAHHRFEVVAWKTTFFMPRRLFWWGYRLMAPIGLASPYVRASLALEKWLKKQAPHRGWELMFDARRRPA